ncbi:NAD(P)-dependent oxidoreductase [Rhodococcus sp. H29-C3]|uniref:NAD(P)-dependent oxidoreductase n=1 Tax=Rhodococcus sp. H29-C3 TaxID=3046307 RepID=UPI0024B9E339|nr:NAD(P)-dependent oxidoreductase [Rhodococcus sp. H29-C3]MDJ0363196.1 NAD(P)-dependent oxidoreductase [Rhodococcus sp. H29-C3]
MSVNTERPLIAVLGTGTIGAPIARSLHRAGNRVTVWNRTASKAEVLALDGIGVATDIAAAVRGADIVLTVVKDAPAVVGLLDAAGDALSSGTVLIQIGTVGVAGIDRITTEARIRGLRLVDAPVLGTKGPAENGQLVVLASAAADIRDSVMPIFDAIGKATIWVSETPGDASKLKLVVNNLISAITHGVAESIALAEALGLDPQLFVDATSGGPLESAFGSIKAQAILTRDFSPSFTVDNAVKDSQLAATAAEDAGVWLPQALAGLERYRHAADLGHGGSDMAASYFAGKTRGQAVVR